MDATINAVPVRLGPVLAWPNPVLAFSNTTRPPSQSRQLAGYSESARAGGPRQRQRSSDALQAVVVIAPTLICRQLAHRYRFSTLPASTVRSLQMLDPEPRLEVKPGQVG